MSELLLAYLYLSLGLGAVFAIGMIYAWRQGDVGFGDVRQRRNLYTMVGGYLLFAVVHGFFQFIAPGL